MDLMDLIILGYKKPVIAISQLSADTKMKNYKSKTSFVSPEGPKGNNTGFNFMIFILEFEENTKKFNVAPPV